LGDDAGGGEDRKSDSGAAGSRDATKVAACRKLIVRIFSDVLPELTKSYRIVPDGMARMVIREYLSSEKKQDTMVGFFLNSKVFQKLDEDDKKTLAICDSDDFLFGLEHYIELPKVRVIRDVLREKQDDFEAALQRGKRRVGWV